MEFNIYQTSKLPDFQPNERINNPKLYVPSEALIDALNVTLTTGLPLLLTGEPGTGKTQLAYHLADHFGLGEPLVYNVRTTSTATDLFYRYDSLRHFQYIQNHKEELSDEEVARRFIRYNALGEAIASGKRKIVLLDEIDKAPRDLPNDILAAIESLSFEIPEINRVGKNKITASQANRPIIIMTSNSEKNLPDAFLRRCVYFHIPFPDTDSLVRILLSKASQFKEVELEMLAQHFQDIRSKTRQKKPATAELIYWALLLEKQAFPIEKLAALNSLSEAERQQLNASYTLLLKNENDLRLIQQQFQN